MTKSVFVSSLLASLSSFTFGLFLTSIGLYIPTIFEQCKKSGFEQYTNLYISLFASFVFFGAFVSSFYVYIFDRLSKRNLLILNNIFYLTGCFFLIQYPNVYLGLFSRFLIGLGAGISCCTVPGYIFLISNESNRGFYMSFNSIGIVSGLVFGKVLVVLFGPARYYLLFAGVMLCLVAHSFSLLLTANVQPKEEDLDKKQRTIADLIRDPSSGKSIVIALAFHIAQHACGIDYFSCFMDEIFKKDEYAGYKSIACLSFSALVNIFSANYIDRLGRKPMILISSSIILISTMIMGTGNIDVFVALLYVLGFNVGLSSIPWFISNEIFPYEYSNASQRLSVAINWLSAFILSTFLKPAHNSYGDPTFFLYSFSMMIFIVLVVLLFKETKGKTEIGFQ